MDVITTHVNADFDCLGAMVAAKLVYPDAAMVFAGSQEPALRDFLTTEICSSLVFERCKNVDFSTVKRLIIVDANASERIGPFAPLLAREDVEVVIYDHHPPVELNRAVGGIIDTGVSSTVTIMVAELQKKQLLPTAAQATMMMLGLYEDTANLLIPTVCQNDYLAAAYLRECGANMIKVAAALNRELTSSQVELLHQLLRSLQLVSIHGVDVYLAQASIDCYVGDLAVLAHKIRDIENLAVVIVAVRLEDRVFLVARSQIDEVNVGAVMASFGGGGHASAASATVHDKTLVQVMQMLPVVLEQTIEPHWQAHHLMSAPVQVTTAEQSIAEVRAKLTRCHVNALVVVDAKAQVVGLISRQTVERAVHHGLDAALVGEYMTIEFGVAPPNGDIPLIQQLVVDQRQRLVPIVEHDKLVGVVTRTDLLRHSVTQGRKLRHVVTRAGQEDGLSLNRRQVTRLLDIRLPSRVRQLLLDLSHVAAAQQLEIYAVGGFVRDLLLGQKNLDVDIVVEGNAIEFARAFAQQFECRVRCHEKFITAVIIFSDGFKVDIASTRTEYYLKPGALPIVEEASIKSDLYRRDFTINTMALSLNHDSYGELIDCFGAQRDLHEKAIRVLHNLSFVEDPTRAFRAVRFEQRLGFKLGMHTERLLRSAVAMGFLEKVNQQRLFHELWIILAEDDPLPAVQRLEQLGLLQFLSAGFKMDDSITGQFSQASKTIAWYDLLYSGTRVQREAVYFLCLSAALTLVQMQQLCERLALPQRLAHLFGEERERYLAAYNQLERYHNDPAKLAKSKLCQMLHGASSEMLVYFMAKTSHETVRALLSHYVTKLRSIKTVLNGADLLQLGVAAGPDVGTMLHQLLAAKIDGVVTTKEDETAFIVQLLSR
ncbi:MAG: CBS domain-containing protein [Desulfuromonas sp.]|nr:CBS domain-containing protein [Desulfuromonas sp.]